MPTRKASIKETGEELSQADWERFDAAVAAAKVESETGNPRVNRARRGDVPGNAKCSAKDCAGPAAPSEAGEGGAPVRR